MIVYRISNGLGNQLFQYVTARVLSFLNNDADLFLEADSFYRTQATEIIQPARTFSLKEFNIRISGYLTSEDQESSLLPDFSNIDGQMHASSIDVYQPLANGGFSRNQTISCSVFSSALLWDPRVLTLRGNMYVNSFGQNWSHFKHFEDILRQELTFVALPNTKNQSYVERIVKYPSASIHVRRTDYVRAGYFLCNLDYYQRAMNYMRAIMPGVTFFVFSDDPSWVIEQWGELSDVEVVSHNTQSQCHEDMRLMSMCNCNIIANSTFSWWAAWLNTRPDKIVIAPKTWKMANETSKRMLLPGWSVM